MGNTQTSPNWTSNAADPPPMSDILPPVPEPSSVDPIIPPPAPTPKVGTYEELHKACKEVAMMPFEGLRFTVNKGLSSHFQAQHTIQLNNEKSSYRMGTTYVGTKQPSPTEAFPVMVGEMDNEGNLQAQFIHLLSDWLRLKCIAQMEGSKMKSMQIGAEIPMKDANLSVVTADPDILNGNGMMIIHYLQAITPKLAIGSELLYQRGAARQQAIMALAGRYKTDNWQAALTLGSMGGHASFFRKANENVSVGVEMEASFKRWESVTTFAYQLDIPKMNLLFKGMLTSEWTVGSSIEKRLLPLPITLNLTGTYNIKQDKVSCGIGAVLGG